MCHIVVRSDEDAQETHLVIEGKTCRLDVENTTKLRDALSDSLRWMQQAQIHGYADSLAVVGNERAA